MQSRLADATRRSYSVLSSANRFTLKRGFCAATRSRTADPAGPDDHKEPAQVSNNILRLKLIPNRIPSKEEEGFVSSKSPCEPSPKLQSTGVNQRLEPSIQQKRKQGSMALEEAICAGLDGSPWPQDKNKEQRIREEQRDDNRDYYKHHKASPLSELEFADSRKPVSRALHGSVDSGRGGDVIVWLPEQLETAEETLMRAAEMWRQNAMRGDPDAPHSRVLRALRGEAF